MIESLRKKSSLGSTVCVPMVWLCIDMQLIDLRKFVVGALVEHKARECVDR